MANRIKEDEKNEKIIRGLLKLPANKRCINCNNLGPQYVCTNFSTFICTNCSGIHREFTHRVKSVSMAKFTSQEVAALQDGANEKARSIYFKEWDPQRNSYPDSSNIDRLRDFIRHVYVEQRFTGGRNADQPPRAKNEREDSAENRKPEYRGGSRSPPYGSRSPGYDQSDYRRSPKQFDPMEDRRRDDKYANDRRSFEVSKLSDGRKPESGSPNYQREVDSSSPPVRPLRDMLGVDGPPLQVGDLPKQINFKISEPPVNSQNAPSSLTSIGSRDQNIEQPKEPSPISLIDFSTDPVPPVSATPQQPIPEQSSEPSKADDWASFGASGHPTTPQAPLPSNTNSLDSALADLLLSEPMPQGNGTTSHASSFDSVLQSNGGTQLQPAMIQQPQILPFQGSAAGASTHQASPDSTFQGSIAAPLQTQAATGQTQIAIDGAPPPLLSMEAKPAERKELPVDLFTSLYRSASAPVPAWATGQQYGMMGYVNVMQYPPPSVAMNVPAYPHQTKPANPFDAGNTASAPSHFPSFAGGAPVQGMAPHMPQQTFMRTSSFGTPQQWAPQPQPPHPQLPPYPTLNTSGAIADQFMNQQQISMNLPRSSANPPAWAPPGNPMMDQHQQPPTSRYSQPNSFGSAGTNPFG